MLLEFSVSNFRSIKDRQTFSMAAVQSARKNERHLLQTSFSSAPQLLESAAIFGANASGKSNFLKALHFLKSFVIDSAKDTQHGEKIEDVTPFLFSPKTSSKPSEFEILFIHKGYLFQYGFIVDSKKVYEEWLYATPQNAKRQRTQTWFERNKDNVEQSYIGKEIKGEKENWKKSTRENALFLSTAVHLNSEDFKKPFSWIQDNLRLVLSPENISQGFSTHQIVSQNKKEKILKFIQIFDTGISDIITSETSLSEEEIKQLETVFRKEMLETLLGQKDQVSYKTYTTHKTEDGTEYKLDLKEESQGTKRLFAFSGPIIDTLENGYTLIVDELHNSLHPHALRGIIALFSNTGANQKNAQLIFTTHDTNIMNTLDRDQIWLAEKKECGQSTLTALTNFKGHADESIEKRYLGGRYGGIPNIQDIFDGT